MAAKATRPSDWVIVAVVLFGAYWMFGGSSETPKSTPNGSALTLEDQNTSIPLPADEKAFVDLVVHYRDSYRSAENDMLKGQERRRRKKAMCASQGTVFNNWIGTVSVISSNSDGKGVFGVQIADEIYMQTWNNSFSDFRHHTLIDPDSSVFANVSRMKLGEAVRFSGQMYNGDNDCFSEQSMTIHGAMTSPDFTTRFDNVQALD